MNAVVTRVNPSRFLISPSLNHPTPPHPPPPLPPPLPLSSTLRRIARKKRSPSTSNLPSIIDILSTPISTPQSQSKSPVSPVPVVIFPFVPPQRPQPTFPLFHPSNNTKLPKLVDPSSLSQSPSKQQQAAPLRRASSRNRKPALKSLPPPLSGDPSPPTPTDVLNPEDAPLKRPQAKRKPKAITPPDNAQLAEDGSTSSTPPPPPPPKRPRRGAAIVAESNIASSIAAANGLTIPSPPTSTLAQGPTLLPQIQQTPPISPPQQQPPKRESLKIDTTSLSFVSHPLTTSSPLSVTTPLLPPPITPLSATGTKKKPAAKRARATSNATKPLSAKDKKEGPRSNDDEKPKKITEPVSATNPKKRARSDSMSSLSEPQSLPPSKDKSKRVKTENDDGEDDDEEEEEEEDRLLRPVNIFEQPIELKPRPRPRYMMHKRSFSGSTGSITTLVQSTTSIDDNIKGGTTRKRNAGRGHSRRTSRIVDIVDEKEDEEEEEIKKEDITKMDVKMDIDMVVTDAVPTVAA